MRHLQEQAVPRYFQANTSVANKKPEGQYHGDTLPAILANNTQHHARVL